MKKKAASVEALRDFANSLPTSREMSAEQRAELIRYLAESWDDLVGTSEQKNFAAKLHRAEDLAWNPPWVTFNLERHGGTVQGSTRADLHHWEVNLDTGAAMIAQHGTRQLVKKAEPLDIGKLAQETAQRIISGDSHPSLLWPVQGSHVVVSIAELIPETNKQTTSGRRKRFRAELERLMNEAGWVRENKGTRLGFRKS